MCIKKRFRARNEIYNIIIIKKRQRTTRKTIIEIDHRLVSTTLLVLNHRTRAINHNLFISWSLNRDEESASSERRRREGARFLNFAESVFVFFLRIRRASHDDDDDDSDDDEQEEECRDDDDR